MSPKFKFPFWSLNFCVNFDFKDLKKFDNIKKLNITKVHNNHQTAITLFVKPEAEFKEFDWRLKFKPRLKYGSFHLKL